MQHAPGLNSILQLVLILLMIEQVPALVRFNGHPEVSQGGELLYVFPSLQRTAKAKVSSCKLCRRDSSTVCVVLHDSGACQCL